MRGEADYRGGLGALLQGGAGSGMFLFSMPVSEFTDRTIAFVVLDSHDLEGDIATMKEFVTTHYRFGVRREAEVVTTKKETLIDKLKQLFRADISYDRNL